MTRRIGGGWLVVRLLALMLLLGGASSAQAGADFCSGYPVVNGFHVIDGNDPALTPLTLPSSIGMDANCSFRNFPISAKWPQGLTSTLNFKSDGYLAIFENLYFGGNMACATTTTRIWFVNNAIYNPNNSCQDLFIPVEAIQKKAPGPTATIGVPFTYTLTVPVMFDPATNTTYAQPSVNTLSNATIYDDLAAIGASATYVSNTAFLVNGGSRTAIGPLALGASPATLSSLGIPASDNTKHIVFSSDANPALTSVAPGTQIEIQMTVVLDDVPSNVAGTQFTNTAKWWFGRVISGTTYAPLPGQSGVSPPMTIVEPGLTLQKTSALTNLNVGTAAPFRLNVQNAGAGDAWNATVTDILPTGMCAADPTPTVTARVFASDGVTPVSGVLAAGTDYTVTYSGCQLGLTMLSAATKIAPTQRLIVTYQARLDAGTGPGLTFTNVAGATQWYSAASGSAARRQYNRTLTNGTPGTLDFQDAYTVTSTTQGYFFLKSVGDLTTGVPVATVAFAGDRLRYTLQIQNFTFPRLNNITITDDLDALNATAAFVPGSLALASSDLPAGVTLTVNPTGGAKGTGSISINGLDLLKDQQYQVQFDVTLAPGVASGATVLNQASLTGTDEFGVAWAGLSDNPYVNGPSLLGATGDVTPVQVYAPGALAKANTQASATIGQQFKYRITVPATPSTVPLYDVRILDNLGLSAARLGFVGASVVSGGSWNLTNTGSPTNLVLQDTTTGIDIPAGSQAVIDITVVLQNVASNANGLTFTNSASYTYNKINGDNATQAIGGGGTTASMTVVEPALGSVKAVSYVSPAGKAAGAAAAAGDVLQYTVTVTNNGTATAYDVDVIDLLPSNLSLVAGSATATINGVVVSGFVAQPTVLASGALVWGAQNGDGLLDIPVGATLVLSYRATVLSANGTPIINSVYTDWGSLDGGAAGERNGAGCPNATAPNTYCAGPATSTVSALDPTALAKTVGADSWATAPSTATDSTLRVGDTVLYTLGATLREGTTQNVVITDTLPAGMAFDSVVSINGDTSSPYSPAAPFSHGDFTGPVVSGSTVSFNFGNVVNAVDNNAGNNVFVIQYRARVVNTLAQLPAAQQLRNDVALNYAIGGAAATPKTSNASINVWQPVLGVSKSAAPAGGDNVLVAGESVTYTVSIQNTGNAPAYNPHLQDILPVGMRNAAPAAVSVSLVNAGTTLPAVTPTYSSATGIATWNFVSGVAGQYAIAPGETLRLVYQAKADAALGAGMVLANRAQVQHYYSLDATDPNASFRKDYGATSAATVQLTTASATALAKQALATSAGIGQPFTYRITLPATPQPTAMHDVRVLDDIGLATTGVSLAYVSASARLASNTKTWATLANGGTATNLALQDTTTGGLDVPAGDQLIVDLVLVLGDDIVNNTAGKQFTNTASYTYNSVNNDNTTQANGAPGASGAITIVAPNLSLQKSGPATMRVGVPGTFTLDVRNTGTGTAWNVVLSDILPNVTTAPIGGMCGAAPANVTARVYQADGVTPVSANLVNGTDFTTSFAGAPACTLRINLLSASTALAPTQRLIVTYGASLDAGSSSGITLTNVAGAIQWRSANPAIAGSSGAIHTYDNTLTNGTPGVLDFQDAHALTTEAPVLEFRKSVVNVTTGQNPGSSARPGDVMRYTVTVRNVSALPVGAATLTDELDRLSAAALFAPGSLRLVSAPAGATSNTNPNGGAKGTGLLEVRGLSVAATGSAGDSLTVVYEARLAPVIKSGAVVLNQAQLASATSPTLNSDDPNVNGADNPAVSGDEDPTRTVVTSNPLLQVKKTSLDMTGDAAILRSGDRLRYTITVKNIGTESAVGVTLRDLVPVNTTYVPGSTTRGGVAVPDAGGVSPLQAGLQIHAPEDPTPGAMRADASPAPANVATITFDVRVNAGVLDGTLISNQGFVNGSGAGSGVFAEVPSDDPRTPAIGDPTRDIVGPYALLVARKTVALVGDTNGNGVLDPLDVVRYTISIDNPSGLAATGVVLTDLVPANTAYVANTVTLNGAPVGRPDGGVSPLITGIPANSPSSAAGTIAPHSGAVITFDARVNAGVAAGTVISNQGTLATELGSQLTDADGDSANGLQPTTIIVGSAQQVSITKAVQVVGGGDALPGSQLEYLVTVTNTGAAAATNVVVTDDLGAPPLPAQVAYVAGSATLNGGAAGVSVTGALLRADYAATHGSLAPGASTQLRFRVRIANGLPLGTLITNTAQVAWNAPALTASASAAIAVGAAAGTASLNGSVWHDANLNKVSDAGETPLQGWTVDVLRNKVLLGTVTTDANGQYAIKGLLPSTTPADQFTLRFNAPGGGANTAKLGRAESPFVNGMQLISGIAAPSGSNLQNLNLPLQPNGVTYDSIVRTPVVGAALDMVRAGSSVPLPSACFDDPVQQGQVTPAGGYYKFDLNFSDPSCPSGGEYLIRVTPPSAYMPGVSKAIPPMSHAGTPSFRVANCPGTSSDAVPATSAYCESQPSDAAPGLAVAAASAGTNHYLRLMFNSSVLPATSQIYNNHVAIDPRLANAVSITKVAGLQNAPRGQLVPYTITVTNTMAVTLTRLSVVDTFPAGFKYVPGSGRVDGQPAEPAVAGNQLTWSNLQLATNAKRVIQLLLIVGSGVSEGTYVNRAQVLAPQLGTVASGEATATVRVVADPTLDCTDVIGKVFDDVNLNGYQDEGERGLPGVRLVTTAGLIVTTDPHGRFHLTCAVVPDPDRGSNFILKIDDRSLPAGYRITTENPQVQRATRGKMIKFNFGAAIHRVVKLDLADGVFEPGTAEMRIQWKQRMALLQNELKKATSVLRLSYLAENENDSLVRERLESIRRQIEAAWKRGGGAYDLTIETEVFRRTGASR
ncbi:isopeptide-forming domain-containing fimbrial protein [Ramlibacter tataouinensis]|uniref:DUF11 domain-containing protein n=1 Tax=Ramlibacter tataouinensis TaxID=94132 RepID=A0A127JZY0_9BURK|nr:isopeptide-forming domain-containing fimbrial protein [Ramlibacter tataouinensis]AMO23702.1 hypothetical protein UC35_13510 [Ramlibacter tataouinensis]